MEMVGRERRQRIMREMNHGIERKDLSSSNVTQAALIATANVRRRTKDR